MDNGSLKGDRASGKSPCGVPGFSPPEFTCDDSGSIPKSPRLRRKNFGSTGRLFRDAIDFVTRKTGATSPQAAS
jgi:hypothetical protein